MTLREARHKADYDLTKKLTRVEAIEKVDEAEEGADEWAVADKQQLTMFLLSALLPKQAERG
ncbi:MAG: hypothetical protein AB2A00_11310 [Myxococcota bacterium]